MLETERIRSGVC